jgi:hypothetical protein
MWQSGTQDLFLMPATGGLTGDPSVLELVNQFLRDESNFEKVNNLVQEEISLQRYQSLIDFLLVELMPEFKIDCFRFYEGKGKSFCDSYPADVRSNADVKLREILEFLVFEDYRSWRHFKSRYETGMNWEPLWRKAADAVE